MLPQAQMQWLTLMSEANPLPTDTACIFLMGPTASGKTDLALTITEHLPCQIISVDSALVYRGMDIGTAKPSAEILARTPHRLIDICDPSEAYSAAQFRNDAMREIADIQHQGQIPLLVGGTGLYFRALQHGLADLPSANLEVRQRLEQIMAEQGLPVLYARLAEVDPVAATKIHPHDPQRVQRALEVFEITGKPMTQWYAEAAATALPSKVVKVVISPSQRHLLHAKIALRFEQMLTQGFMQEMETLYQRADLHSQLPSMRAVGYRQAWQYLNGELDYASMVEKAIIATRQLAKRQLTWLRAETGAQWFASQQTDTTAQVLQYLQQHPMLSHLRSHW